MSFRLIPLVATTALLASASAALAQSATATSDVNVRSGPGAQYEVIDRLPAGERVNVVDCRGEWCEIGMGGESGFVARGYLDDGYGRSRAAVRAPAYERRDDYDGDEPVAIERDDPSETDDLVVGGYYESRPFYVREGYYYWGGRWYARRPGAPGWRTGSWRRWEERRGARDERANRPPRGDDRRARIDRGDDGRDRRFQPMERRDAPDRERAPDRQRERDGGSRANIDRGDGARGGGESRGGGEPRASEPGRGGGDAGQRAERPEARGGGAGQGATGGGGRAPDGGGRTPGSNPNDRGDRIGLDRAAPGGGGRSDR